MIVAGFGYRASASVDSLLNALDKAAEQVDCEVAEIQTYATPIDKLETSVFQSLINQGSTKSSGISADEISGMQTLTQSNRAQEMRGTGSVAEACALIAAGPKAELLGPRVISDDRMATCALAKGETE